jgi:glucosamine-6-phosphate deaminase
MPETPSIVLRSPDAIGEYLAERLLQQIDAARLAHRPFLLGCPTGRTPRPIFGAMAQRIADRQIDVRHVVLVMMDEYLVPGDGGRLQYAPPDKPWSCHHFARAEIAGPFNTTLPTSKQLPDESIWFPDPHNPEAYDARIAKAGGIDFFLLASGASDGHVAFNPPGSPRASRTRIIPLSDDTRRDNLQTFPTFKTLDAVPHHGISVGISTITSSKAAAMVVWGTGKRLTLQRIRAASRYDAAWPATLIHECRGGEIIADDAAASASGT